MLLLHQTGSVKIGEVVRYTVTYRPSSDHILPSPEFLYLRIKNSSAIALRAAFVHGPYTLSVAAYPSHFDPNQKFENPRRYGVPEFEPMLKAGGSWNCHLVVPDNIRQSAGEGSSKHGQFGGGPEHDAESVSWVIEVASQVIFSASAAVHYEILLARDEKSLNLGSVVPVIGGQAQVPQPGRVSDFQQSIGSVKDHPSQPKGIFSRAIRLTVEDTASLWNTPALPCWEEGCPQNTTPQGGDPALEPVRNEGPAEKRKPAKKQKKVHLVVLTHGLHSNLGADMLFLKESIDAGVRQAKADARARKARERAARSTSSAKQGDGQEGGNPSEADSQTTLGEGLDEDDEEEEVVVRGFSGNATRTERGIKYLGKRLARYVLSMTHPDQPFLPTSRAASEAIVQSLKAGAHRHSSEKKQTQKKSGDDLAAETRNQRAYKITKISFIAHSLGGLVQTYAVAYIQKHSPKFFNDVEPINFIALATPFLGLNHENPLYVKFALDFGLVGRTGQDLGLTWRAPTIARNGWGAIVSNLGENAHRHVYGETQPESKPLLRILPTGPAHTALKRFRNRTVYSNVVNDGIVPLRTSCLLFLDWQGLGRVDKARREAGLVETVVGFGWAELTGANSTASRIGPWLPEETQNEQAQEGSGDSTPTGPNESSEVPQPPSNATLEDDRQSIRATVSSYGETSKVQDLQTSTTTNNPFSGLLNFFRNNDTPKKSPPPSPKLNKIYQRSQTLNFDELSVSNSASSLKSKATTGQELGDNPEGVIAPPKTTVFEAAGDLLNPKLPSIEYLIDPSKRPRAIFHDRIYHPSDIPPAPLKKRPAGSTPSLRPKSETRTGSSNVAQKSAADSDASSAYPSPPAPRHQDSASSQRDYDDTANTNPDMDPSEMIDGSQMKVEEKIARAYHRGLSWRKVLVKLEPDAHNNIIVRRKFANAFGWPVIHHLVEAHFSDSAAARTRDEHESGAERAKSLSEPPTKDGAETTTQTKRTKTNAERGIGGYKDEIDDGKQEEEEEEDEGEGTPKGKQKAGPENAGLESETAREAMDVVPNLPGSPTLGSEENPLGVVFHSPKSLSPSSSRASGLTGTSRPRLVRHDSVTWSDRDWLESEDESDSESSRRGNQLAGSARRVLSASTTSALGSLAWAGGQLGGEGDKERSSSPTTTWNWAEKIVGKGAIARPKSLVGPASPTVAVYAEAQITPPPATQEQNQQQSTRTGDAQRDPMDKI